MTRISFEDARWFPVDLHVPDRRFSFVRIDDSVVERSAFLDVRIEADLNDAVAVAATALPSLPTAGRLGWLFHTSFCGSTLLARMLHSVRRTVLREPLVLRRLADAQRVHWGVDGLLEPTVRLLARPWAPSSGVVIKPTHAALGLAVHLMEASRSSNAIVLTSSLDDFLVSNLKKTRETLAKVPELAERALNASSFGRRLHVAALTPPNLLAAVGLQWAAQRELCGEAFEQVGEARMRTLAADELYARPLDVAVAAASWFGFTEDVDELLCVASREAYRNAKATTVPYDAKTRALEAEAVAHRYADELRAARAWFDRCVAPHMQARALHFDAIAPLMAQDVR